MKQVELVARIRTEIVDANLHEYRELFATQPPAAASDSEFKRALALHASLSTEQRDALFRLMRRVMVDTVSSMLGVLDGGAWFGGPYEGFKLTTVSGSEKLNEGLQDLFLGMEESDPR
jgi:hypothetical protein